MDKKNKIQYIKHITVFQLGIENGGVRIWKKGTSARQKL